jgi:hypothetical protein
MLLTVANRSPVGHPLSPTQVVGTDDAFFDPPENLGFLEESPPVTNWAKEEDFANRQGFLIPPANSRIVGQESSFPSRRTVAGKDATTLAPTFKTGFRPHQHIGSRARPPHRLIRQTALSLFRRCIVRYDNHQIVIAVRTGLPARYRSKQIDALRIVGGDKTAQQFGQRR